MFAGLPLTKVKNVLSLRLIESITSCRVHLHAGPPRCVMPSKGFCRGCLLIHVTCTSDDAIAYATVRAKLERAGTPIGPLDTLIASQAVARKLVLVTNNERELRRRVTGLHLENWTN